MTSLKARLILAFSLITVIPLAIAMVLLTVRIESMVRSQATERLQSALGGMRDQVATDGKQIAAKLEILGRDPVLKRLYLLRPAGSRDLSDYLTERQFLLGLDFLSVADSSGEIVAAGPAPGSRAGASGVSNGLAWNAPAIGAVEGAGSLAMIARSPILYQSLAA